MHVIQTWMIYTVRRFLIIFTDRGPVSTASRTVGDTTVDISVIKSLAILFIITVHYYCSLASSER